MLRVNFLFADYLVCQVLAFVALVVCLADFLCRFGLCHLLAYRLHLLDRRRLFYPDRPDYFDLRSHHLPALFDPDLVVADLSDLFSLFYPRYFRSPYLRHFARFWHIL